MKVSEALSSLELRQRAIQLVLRYVQKFLSFMKLPVCVPYLPAATLLILHQKALHQFRSDALFRAKSILVLNCSSRRCYIINHDVQARAVSRNLSKFKQWELPPDWVKLKNNCSVHGKKLEITQQTEKEALINKSEEDGNGFAILVFENLTYLFVTFDILLKGHIVRHEALILLFRSNFSSALANRET